MFGDSPGTGAFASHVLHHFITFDPRYRDGSNITNRHGFGNLRPSFWAATGHSEPWRFLRKDPDGYKMFIDTLPTLETGTEGEKSVFREWSHLLKRQPTKEDRSAGQDRGVS